MRWWTIPILGAVAFSISDPSTANARPRFGPGAVLGAVAAPLGALLGGVRPSFAQQRRSATTGRSRSADPARTGDATDPARTGETERVLPPARGQAGWGRCSGRMPPTTCSSMRCSRAEPASVFGPTVTRTCTACSRTWARFAVLRPLRRQPTRRRGDVRRQGNAHRLVRQRGGGEQRRRGDRAHRASRGSRARHSVRRSQSCGPRWRRPATASRLHAAPACRQLPWNGSTPCRIGSGRCATRCSPSACRWNASTARSAASRSCD